MQVARFWRVTEHSVEGNAVASGRAIRAIIAFAVAAAPLNAAMATGSGFPAADELQQQRQAFCADLDNLGDSVIDDGLVAADEMLRRAKASVVDLQLRARRETADLLADMGRAVLNSEAAVEELALLPPTVAIADGMLSLVEGDLDGTATAYSRARVSLGTSLDSPSGYIPTNANIEAAEALMSGLETDAALSATVILFLLGSLDSVSTLVTIDSVPEALRFVRRNLPAHVLPELASQLLGISGISDIFQQLLPNAEAQLATVEAHVAELQDCVAEWRDSQVAPPAADRILVGPVDLRVALGGGAAGAQYRAEGSICLTATVDGALGGRLLVPNENALDRWASYTLAPATIGRSGAVQLVLQRDDGTAGYDIEMPGVLSGEGDAISVSGGFAVADPDRLRVFEREWGSGATLSGNWRASPETILPIESCDDWVSNAQQGPVLRGRSDIATPAIMAIPLPGLACDAAQCGWYAPFNFDITSYRSISFDAQLVEPAWELDPATYSHIRNGRTIQAVIRGQSTMLDPLNRFVMDVRLLNTGLYEGLPEPLHFTMVGRLVAVEDARFESGYRIEGLGTFLMPTDIPPEWAERLAPGGTPPVGRVGGWEVFWFPRP